MVNIYLEDASLAKVDRLRAGTPTSPGASRNAYCSWLVTQALAGIPDTKAPKAKPPRSTLHILATPAAEAALHEGARLRAARIAAGLSHEALAESVSNGIAADPERARSVPPVSRGQVQRAERAGALDGYPALRAWLEGQEAKP